MALHGDAQGWLPEEPIERQRAAAQRKANRATAMTLSAVAAAGLLAWGINRRKQRRSFS